MAELRLAASKQEATQSSQALAGSQDRARAFELEIGRLQEAAHALEVVLGALQSVVLGVVADILGPRLVGGSLNADLMMISCEVARLIPDGISHSVSGVLMSTGTHYPNLDF